MWRKFQDVFNVFPLAAVVDEKVYPTLTLTLTLALALALALTLRS